MRNDALKEFSFMRAFDMLSRLVTLTRFCELQLNSNKFQVQIDEIPLPSATEKPTPSALPKINLPPPVLLINVPPPSILKKQTEESPNVLKDDSKEKEPPGVPPTPPIDLFAMRELDSDYEESEKEELESEDEIPLPKKKSLRFSDDVEKKESDEEKTSVTAVQQKMLSLSGQNIDDFMKEMENVQKKKNEEEKALEIKRVDPTPDVEDVSEKKEPAKAEVKEPEVPKNPIPMPSIVLPPPMPGIPAPPALMFRPSHLFRPGIPAPPMRPGLRMPPGPPTGPRPMHALRGPPMGGPHHPKHHPGPSQSSKDPKSATITAKPQIRNLSADVTRFVPTTLRVKRDDSYKKPKPQKMFQEIQKQVNQGPTKDDAYLQFMNEMQGLL